MGSMNEKEQGEIPLEIPIITRESPSSGNENVLPALQMTIALRNSLYHQREVRFCQQCSVTFYEQNTTFTCSYASVQMVVSALLSSSRIYRQELFQGIAFVPDIRSIQVLMERAWKEGFDVEGSHHFGGKLVGKREKIGCSDIAALFRSTKIPTRIYDVDYGVNSWRCVELFCEHHFFTENNRFPVFPLILGYAEHTMIVVGCEREDPGTGILLLVFDPGSSVRRAMENAKSNVKAFYANVNLLKTRTQFQILKFGPSSDHDSLLTHEASDETVAGKKLRAIHPPRVV